MKRLITPRGQLTIKLLPTQRRSGKAIIQSMVYLTILAALLGVGGICLHAAMRMDRSDQKDQFLIRSLLRCERQLREDAVKSKLSVTQPSSLTVSQLDQSEIRWTSNRGVLTRELVKEGQIKARDQFRFPAGTNVEFHATESGVVVRIIEPSDLVKYAEAADGSTHPTKPESLVSPPIPDGAAPNRTVEIYLRGAP